MSNPVTYNEFFKGFVLRKKQELVNPRFFGIGEIILPRNSLIHFLPKNPTDYGPSNSEAFIHNFPKEVYIDFSTDLPEFLMGNGRMDTFEVKKAIQAYRAKHYQYNWTRDISTVYNKENVLIVKNYGLVPHRVIYRPSIYMNYEKYYNLQSLIFDNVNKEAAKGKRKQYMRIELPLNMPSFTALSDDYRKFISSFKNGLPVLTPQIVSSTKAENSYWLLDMLAFLVGQYEFSLFNKISPEALEDFHIIFTFQSKALVVKLGLLKEWLDSAGPREIKEYKTAREAFEAVKPTPRMNAVKRFYLALMGLSRNFTPEQEIIKEETNAREEKDSNSSFDTEVAGGEESEQTKSSGRNNAKEKGVPGKNAPANTSPVPSSVADVFSSAETDNGQPDEAEGGEAEGGNSESVEEWTSQVDETLLEVEQVTAEVNTDRDPFSTPEAGIKAALDERARDGVLTVAEQEFFMIKGTRFKNIEMENGQTLEEFIHVDPKELEDLDGKIKGKFLTVLDESVLRSRSTALKIEYSDKFLKKDIAKMFLGVQNAGLALNDYRPENHTSVEGSYDVYNVQLHDVNGEQTTIRPRLPRVDPDGTFIVDGVKQHMQIQRREKPFRKISPTKVALTTYYDRKLMIQRSEKVVDNLGTWMVKQISLQSKEKGYTFSKGGSYDRELDSPRIYSLLSKQYKFIDVDGYRLDFQFKDILAKHPEFKKYLKRDLFLIGVKDGLPLTIDDFGNLYKDGQAFGTIEDLLGVNLRKAPLEHAVVNISGFLFPLGVVLCFYFGITKLLKVIKATTRTVPIGTRPKLANDEYAIQFNDQYLILNRREKLATLIFGGMPKLNNIGNFSMTDLNNKSIWPSLMGDPRVRPSQFQEMKNLYDLFIDPISKEELRKMGLSESFHYLLIDAAKALETDFSRHEVEIEEQRLVGYERFAGHIYTELVRSIRQYRNKGKGRKHKLDFNPDAVIINIGKDTSVQQVEEVNPIHQIKDQEELTFGGDGGRSQITMVKRARVQLESYKGIVSEANKDSSNVGYVTYATSDPGVADFRGNIDVKNIPSYTGLGSITMNLMYGGTHDDPKRASFTSTQASQAVSSVNYETVTLRSGYENVVAHRTSELYSKIAKDDGKVTELVDDCITVTYNDGTTDKYPLGLVIGVASGEYHRHTRVTDLKVGDTFEAGSVIGWDDNWFGRDPFCPGQVAIKMGKMCRIALVEDQDVYEDSVAVSKELAMESLTPFIKMNRFLLDVTYVLDMKVKVGDIVEQDAILCNIEEPHLVDGEIQSGFMEEVNKLGIKQIRAKHHGKIIGIEVEYNSTIDKMSESIAKFIVKKDRERKRASDIVGGGIKNGAINNAFNVNRPILNPDKALVKIFIESMESTTTADKYVLGNQMKATVGRIMDKPLMTKSGLVVDIKASFKGMFNRMVLSFRNKLITNEAGYQFTKMALDVYKGK